MVKRLVIVLSILVGLVSICISGCETQEQEVKKLIKALQHKNSQVRRAEAGKLGEIGEDAKDVVPALTIALQDESRDVCTSCSRSIRCYRKKCHRCCACSNKDITESRSSLACGRSIN